MGSCVPSDGRRKCTAASSARKLAERLIASVRGREDELPLLQHGLMLMWEEAKRRAPPGVRVTLDGRIVDEAGGARRAFVELRRRGDGDRPRPDQRREWMIEAVFRELTDVNAEGSAIRRPPLSAISAR